MVVRAIMKRRSELLQSRRAGVVLPIFSLPSKHGTGDIGIGAHRFIEWLSEAGMTLWQMLPLGPTGYGNSPYSSYSAFAAQHLFISLDFMYRDGLLAKKPAAHSFSATSIDYDKAAAYKHRYLLLAYQKFVRSADPKLRNDYIAFVEEQAHWLLPYSWFMSLKHKYGQKPWYHWDVKDRVFDRNVLTQKMANDTTAHFHCFLQFIFHKQWSELRGAAAKKGIVLMGDMPIFVAHDSADVWSNPSEFTVNQKGEVITVAGVPPDYFSETGQLWGNPLYRWDVMRENNFLWWKQRFQQQFSLFDCVRVDHFRGFESYWEIPGNAATAVHGTWKKAPGKELFEELMRHFGTLPIIAEDLGIITDEVRQLRDYFSFPGMKVLQFGFDSRNPHNEFLPHNFTHNCVCYTGTHDNDTTVGWIQSASPITRTFIKTYLGTGSAKILTGKLIEAAMSSVARMVIIPMQDVLEQSSRFRMNVPGKQQGNWGYRIRTTDLKKIHAAKMRRYIEKYAR
jgi:4-alpha-glucanotransferase